MDFTNLTTNINQIHTLFNERAKQSINMALTIRNWLFGYYIQEYEFGGTDRAEYGERLLESLADELRKNNVPASTFRSLQLYKQFYQCYKAIGPLERKRHPRKCNAFSGISGRILPLIDEIPEFYFVKSEDDAQCINKE